MVLFDTAFVRFLFAAPSLNSRYKDVKLRLRPGRVRDPGAQRYTGRRSAVHLDDCRLITRRNSVAKTSRPSGGHSAPSGGDVKRRAALSGRRRGAAGEVRAALDGGRRLRGGRREPAGEVQPLDDALAQRDGRRGKGRGRGGLQAGHDGEGAGGFSGGRGRWGSYR